MATTPRTGRDPLETLAKMLGPGSGLTPVKGPAPLRWTTGVVQALNGDGTIGLTIDGGTVVLPGILVTDAPMAVSTTVNVLVANQQLFVLGISSESNVSIPAGRLFCTTGQTLTSGSINAPITGMTEDTTFETVLVTVGTSELTIVTPGRYRVSASLNLSGSGSNIGPVQMDVVKNSSAIVLTTGQPTASFLGGAVAFLPVSDTVRFAEGDSISLFATNLSGQDMSVVTGTAHSWLSLMFESA